MQNNLKRARSQRDLKLVTEEFRSRFACYWRNRPLLQQLMDHQLPEGIEYAVRVHVWNCHRCRQVYDELKELTGVKDKVKDKVKDAKLHSATTPLPMHRNAPLNNRQLVLEQKRLIETLNNLTERLKKKDR